MHAPVPPSWFASRYNSDLCVPSVTCYQVSVMNDEHDAPVLDPVRLSELKALLTYRYSYEACRTVVSPAHSFVCASANG